MLKIKGYYSDEKIPTLQSIFVAIETNEKRLTIYSPTEQHSEGDWCYVLQCKKISKSKYKELSKNFYTPSDYL